MNCDLARLTAAFTKHLATDLTHALGVQVGTIQVTHVPDEKATQVPSDAGLSMQTDAGAADFEINFGHQDGVEESDLPIELLRRVEHGLSSGDVPIPNVFSAFGSTAAGGAATLSDVEIRIRSKNAPTPEEIAAYAAWERAEALTKAAAQSRTSSPTRAARSSGRRTTWRRARRSNVRAISIAVRAASGAQSACDYLISELPERFPGDEKEIQFEWLLHVRAARRELAEQNAKLVEGLEQVTMAVQARTIGKKQRLHVDKMMASLREQQLPLVKPPLEDSGSLSLHSLHEEFYHSRDLLAGRRALSVAVAKYAAKLDVESTQQMSLLEVQANEEKGRARKVKSKRPPRARSWRNAVARQGPHAPLARRTRRPHARARDGDGGAAGDRSGLCQRRGRRGARVLPSLDRRRGPPRAVAAAVAPLERRPVQALGHARDDRRAPAAARLS